MLAALISSIYLLMKIPAVLMNSLIRVLSNSDACHGAGDLWLVI